MAFCAAIAACASIDAQGFGMTGIFRADAASRRTVKDKV
jgi:hypothetical protein